MAGRNALVFFFSHQLRFSLIIELHGCGSHKASVNVNEMIGRLTFNIIIKGSCFITEYNWMTDQFTGDPLGYMPVLVALCNYCDYRDTFCGTMPKCLGNSLFINPYGDYIVSTTDSYNGYNVTSSPRL